MSLATFIAAVLTGLIALGLNVALAVSAGTNAMWAAVLAALIVTVDVVGLARHNRWLIAGRFAMFLYPAVAESLVGAILVAVSMLAYLAHILAYGPPPSSPLL